MAYTFDTLASASPSPRRWTYTTSDARATVTGSGYFARAAAAGLAVGDIVTVTNGADTYPVEITAIETTGNATGAIAERFNPAGAYTISGAFAFSTMPTLPVTAVAATGTNQATAAALSYGANFVSAADATKAVRLPAAVAGAVVIVKNEVAAELPLFPATGDAINAGAANAALTMAASTSAVLVAKDATTWASIPLLPS